MASDIRHNRDSNNLPDPGLQVCLVGERLKENKPFIKAIEKCDLPIVSSESGLEFINKGGEFSTIYILDEFDGPIFTALRKAGQRILGPTTVMQCAERNEPLPNRIRPLYTISMQDVIISFSGFRAKEDLSEMVDLIHYMDGKVKKFDVSKTTHLVASPTATNGEKYKYAAGYGIPIMSVKWVYAAWDRRNEVSCNAAHEEFVMQFKLLPFVGCKIALMGYQNDEEEHMIQVATKNGGEVVQASDSSCTHIVVEDSYSVKTDDYDPSIYIVKNEWFWACIQMEAKAQEHIYEFKNPITSSSSHIIPVGGNKRKRLESVAHQLAMESLQDTDYFALNQNIEGKKKMDVAKLSISGSFLDATFSPDKSLDISVEFKDLDANFKSPPIDMRNFSARRQVCCELFQTESNYVGILNTIMTVFKEPLEKPEHGVPLLAPAEIKIIFGNLPPIFDIHQKIRNELASIIHSWSDDHSIGSLILNHSQDFMKAYPPFVNFFEKTKEVLASCDAAKPRFHAFLKRCQSKPECGRQTLQELLIRPVQRLPSVILLLTDMLKHTQKSNADYSALENAIQALKDVMMHINEDKRKTEGQVAMFDVVNDIENCPANLLSSHRNLISKTDMMEVTDLLNRKGGTVTMFLFTDVLEICRKKSKANNNSLRSPGVASLSGTLKHQTKSYKHLDLIQLSHIKRVVDITETDDCKNYFAIVTWSSKEIKELLYAFVLFEDTDKSTFLRMLCRQIANSVCKADTENLLTSLEPEQLSLQSNDNLGILSKAFNKTKDKLGRALSFRRTPTKRGLSRAVSTIISPLRNFGTPSNNMQTLRLSSVTNLTEFEPPSDSLASSPTGSKRLKSSSLGVSVVKYV